MARLLYVCEWSIFQFNKQQNKQTRLRSPDLRVLVRLRQNAPPQRRYDLRERVLEAGISDVQHLLHYFVLCICGIWDVFRRNVPAGVS